MLRLKCVTEFIWYLSNCTLLNDYIINLLFKNKLPDINFNAPEPCNFTQ